MGIGMDTGWVWDGDEIGLGKEWDGISWDGDENGGG